MSSEEQRKVGPRQLERQAFLYVRQSTLRQVVENTERTERQYALRRRAIALGWPSDRVKVIDCDQGQSGASAADREGCKQLVSEVGMGHAGIVMALEVFLAVQRCSGRSRAGSRKPTSCGRSRWSGHATRWSWRAAATCRSTPTIASLPMSWKPTGIASCTNSHRPARRASVSARQIAACWARRRAHGSSRWRPTCRGCGATPRRHSESASKWSDFSSKTRPPSGTTRGSPCTCASKAVQRAR